MILFFCFLHLDCVEFFEVLFNQVKVTIGDFYIFFVASDCRGERHSAEYRRDGHKEEWFVLDRTRDEAVNQLHAVKGEFLVVEQTHIAHCDKRIVVSCLDCKLRDVLREYGVRKFEKRQGIKPHKFVALVAFGGANDVDYGVLHCFAFAKGANGQPCRVVGETALQTALDYMLAKVDCTRYR
mgnify:CR=1 FL=1